MAFTFTNFQPSGPQEYGLQNLIAQALGGYKEASNAKFQQPLLTEELKKAQQYNQYYPQDIMSQIGLRGAQTGEAGARTGLIGSQTQGQNIENQFMPEKMRAAIQQVQAITAKRQAEQAALNYAFGGNFPSGQTTNTEMPNQNYGSQTEKPNMTAQQPIQQQPDQQPTQQPQANSLSPMQSAAISKLLGFDINPGQTEKIKSLAGSDAKKISNLEDTALTASGRLDNINQAMAIIDSPEFQEMRKNPALGSLELKAFGKFGTPRQQQLVGDFRAFTGQLLTDASTQFKGTFRAGEQGLLNSMKPNDSDSLGSMQGKIQALALMVNMMKERATVEASLMREQGLSPLKARDEADKLMQTDKMKEGLSNKINPTRELNGKQYKKVNGEWHEL